MKKYSLYIIIAVALALAAAAFFIGKRTGKLKHENK